MPIYPDVSADDLFASANIDASATTEAGQADDEIEAQNLFIASRTMGLLQTKPAPQQQVVLHELAARYLPRLTAAFRRCRTPNNAPQTLMNYSGHTPYFMRFSKTPGGADLARIQAKRMAHADLLPSEDLHATIAEICQFLSTLFVVYGLDNLDEEDRAPLLRKLRTWNEEYRGRFAEETTGRCIQMLAPEGQEGMQMEHFLMPLMRMTLSLGVEMCAIKGCPSEKDENRQLMQCGRCRTVRYCGVKHQKEDWARHKNVCFSTAF